MPLPIGTKVTPLPHTPTCKHGEVGIVIGNTENQYWDHKIMFKSERIPMMYAETELNILEIPNYKKGEPDAGNSPSGPTHD